MTAQRAPSSGDNSAATSRDALFEQFSQLEDASREIRQTASMLASYFDALASHEEVENDDHGMHAAFGWKRVAYRILKNLDTIDESARALLKAVPR